VYGSVTLNNGSYGMPMYTAAAGQADTTVTFNVGGYCPSWAGDFTGNHPWSVPIPTGVHGAGGSDGSVIIYSPSLDQDWEFWQLHAAGTGYTACAGGTFTNLATSTGVAPTAAPTVSASDISYLATLITESDVQNGTINHAVAIALQDCAPGFVAPANRGESNCSTTGGPPMGTRFRFPANLAMPSGLTSLGQMVFKAIQTYGVVVTDYAGGAGIAAQTPPVGQTDYITQAMSKEQPYQALANLPWSSLEAVAEP
jgi:hypothetical protein